MDRQAKGIHHCVKCARQAPSRATHILLIVVGDAGSMLVHSHDEGIVGDSISRAARGVRRPSKCGRLSLAVGAIGPMSAGRGWLMRSPKPLPFSVCCSAAFYRLDRLTGHEPKRTTCGQ